LSGIEILQINDLEQFVWQATPEKVEQYKLHAILHTVISPHHFVVLRLVFIVRHFGFAIVIISTVWFGREK
jgi:hypothetical protein